MEDGLSDRARDMLNIIKASLMQQCHHKEMVFEGERMEIVLPDSQSLRCNIEILYLYPR